MQAFSSWTGPTGVLGELVAAAEVRARALSGRVHELERAAADAPPAPSFASALSRPDVAVVAEVKRRSPSKGWINAAISAPDQAVAYARGGAAAISVLTEPDRFGGSNADLEAVRAAVAIPALKKDFHVDVVQLVEARALGASAALLIARALAPRRLREMVGGARQLGLEILLEVRDEQELDDALSLEVPVIGINNRNLETLAIDPATSERLLAMVPGDRVAIAESGVAARGDVERYATAGADAVLVGSSISGAAEPSAAVRALTGVTKRSRAR